jgi:hypothetical protein
VKPNRLIPHKGSVLKNYNVHCSPVKSVRTKDGCVLQHKVLLKHKHRPDECCIVAVKHEFPKRGASKVSITSGAGKQGPLAQKLVSKMFKQEAQIGKPKRRR